MSDCQRCGGRAHNAYLCNRCRDGLRSQLRELPWWLECLTEQAQGRTRMSDNGGRRSARRKDIDGDATIASCIERLPDNPDHDLERARRDRQKAALAHALATGRIDARASELLGAIADGLLYWCRVTCEHRGITYAPRPITEQYGQIHAAWLEQNIAAVVLFDSAGDIAGDVESWTDDIVRVVNRPIRWWTLGQCTTERKDGPCDAELPRVPEGTETVTCRECREPQNVHRILLARKYERDGKPQTRKQLTRYNAELPPEFQVPERTLRDWLERGALTPCDITDNGDPLYSWVDVRMLMLTSKHGTVRRRASGTA